MRWHHLTLGVWVLLSALRLFSTSLTVVAATLFVSAIYLGEWFGVLAMFPVTLLTFWVTLEMWRDCLGPPPPYEVGRKGKR